MAVSESTCSAVIRGAAAGRSSDRNEVAHRYLGVVRAYLGARWRGSWLCQEIDDATQEVFVECFRRGGAVEAAGAGRVTSFRAFLYGVIRNVARRFESRPVRAAGTPPDVATDEGCQLRLLERTWAQAIMTEAARLQRRRAAERGHGALQRVELLRLRFEENLPIRTIAERWGVDATRLHHAYVLARQEFRTVLLEVVAFHHPGSPAEVEQEAAGLLRCFS
jgi:RNA polymerase sigma-70 factor (ECF subfamily)